MKASLWIARLLPVRPCVHPAAQTHVHDGARGVLFCECCSRLVRVRGSFLSAEYSAPQEVTASNTTEDAAVGLRVISGDLTHDSTDDSRDVDHDVIPLRRFAVGSVARNAVGKRSGPRLVSESFGTPSGAA